MPDPRHFLMCILLVGFFGICSNASAQSSNTNAGCPSIDLKVTTSKSNGVNSAEAEVSGAAAPVYYIFFHPSGVLVDKNRDVTQKRISGLKPGSYFCSISDRNGCTKKIEFKVD
jgi:hypothetical protein